MVQEVYWECAEARNKVCGPYVVTRLDSGTYI